ncbi:coiled-coil domain-containing protein 86 [Thrips palmi]|uniref:Coiled-coil domain-containing protein 86 n=1 Tax=Thrips palmi TaxID=161013 RepID=A0A6P8YDF9_THRPL|nr:coiled-coil domain-containing protein 86 [Thrips palmi]XP_034237723.1 coiled-coil domain-containing protein 86 [Thrips palmi]
MAIADQDAVALRIQSILNNSATEEKKTETEPEDDSSSSEDENAQKSGNVRSRRPGNRFWKNEKTRFTTLIASKGLKQSFEAQQKLRNELKHARELSRSVKEKRAQMKQAKRERRKESKRRQEENARKSEIVQVIKNPAKLKRLKKKQLRNIEKRDTLGSV